MKNAALLQRLNCPANRLRSLSLAIRVLELQRQADTAQTLCLKNSVEPENSGPREPRELCRTLSSVEPRELCRTLSSVEPREHSKLGGTQRELCRTLCSENSMPT